ncbi:hypothetical protein [Streptomyces sp. NPDC002328]|uniref:hypothetical protein n=1 Tax=Streptomyces sp. NPDC002328 TaxID=3364642 RepID=UPI00367EBF62
MPDVTSSGEDRNRRTMPEQAHETRVNPANPVSPVDPVHKDTTPDTAATGAPARPAEPKSGRDTLPGTGIGTRKGEGAGTESRTEEPRREELRRDEPLAGTSADPRTAPSAGGTHVGSNGSNGSNGVGRPQGSPLLPNDECDQLASRMQHAVAGFVDRPRDAVEEADHVLEELAARFTDAVNTRRRTLRGAWQAAEGKAEGRKGDTATTADTEQLRLALRDYRELTERLLHV